MKHFTLFILSFVYSLNILAQNDSIPSSVLGKEIPPIIMTDEKGKYGDDDRTLPLPVHIYYSHTTGEVYIQYEDYADCDYYITTQSGQIVTSGTLLTPGTYKVLIPPTIIAPYLIIDNRRIYAVYEL